MAAVTICSDLRTQEKEICYCFLLFHFYLPWVMGLDAIVLVFLILSFKPAFSLSSFTLIKRLFSSSLLSAIKVVSSTYLRLLMFLLAILSPARYSSSLAFIMMCSVYMLNKQGDNKQPCCTPFSILNQSVVPYKVLTVASWPSYWFLRRQIRRSGIPISLSVLQFVILHTSKGFSVVNETKVDICLEFPCFLVIQQMFAIWSLVPVLSKSFNIWKFSIHIMLKLSLMDFEHSLTSTGDECNCLVVWTFLSTSILGN